MNADGRRRTAVLFKPNEDQKMNAIEIKGLTKKYKDVTAVDGLNLEIEKGSLFALLGINGAGKTTTIKMLTGLTQPDAGDALLLGSSVLKQREQVKSCIGVSPQETAVAPHLTVWENLALMCGVHGLSREKTRERVSALGDMLGLQPMMGKQAGRLSGGQQRRVSIAMALISEPAILFLDEPTLGLDVVARRALWDSIRALKGKTTILLTTHYLEEAEALSDRIGIMKDGRLLALGTAEEIMRQTGAARFEDAFIAVVKGESK